MYNHSLFHLSDSQHSVNRYTQQMHQTELFISTTAAAYLFIQYSRFWFSTDNWIAKFLNKHAMRTALRIEKFQRVCASDRCIENNRKVGNFFHWKIKVSIFNWTFDIDCLKWASIVSGKNIRNRTTKLCKLIFSLSFYFYGSIVCDALGAEFDVPSVLFVCHCY